jgi:hypothetical protein
VSVTSDDKTILSLAHEFRCARLKGTGERAKRDEGRGVGAALDQADVVAEQRETTTGPQWDERRRTVADSSRWTVCVIVKRERQNGQPRTSADGGHTVYTEEVGGSSPLIDHARASNLL